MKFETKIYKLEDMSFPIIKAAFKGADGKIYGGIMLIDSGSVDCILNKSVLELIGKTAVNRDDTKEICTVKGESVICPSVNLRFRIGNGDFDDTFYINDTMEFESMFGRNFIGIIGHKFLRKHRMVLDYSSNTLHTSPDKIDMDIKDFSYIFPMEFGLEQYNVPVVGLVQGDKEFILVADSGANTTVMTKHVIDDGNFSCGEKKDTGSVTCINNKNMESSICDVSLCLISLGGTPENPKLTNASDTVQIIDYCDYILNGLKDKEGKDISPISGLLSSDFMSTHKWVLDFGLNIIYSQK